MADEAAVRNFKDFLLIYNRMAEMCFNHCVDDLNHRDLSNAEIDCVNKCSTKTISINHKLMGVYMEVHPEIIAKRIEAVNQQQALLNAAVVTPDSVIKNE